MEKNISESDPNRNIIKQEKDLTYNANYCYALYSKQLTHHVLLAQDSFRDPNGQWQATFTP